MNNFITQSNNQKKQPHHVITTKKKIKLNIQILNTDITNDKTQNC